MKLFLTVSALSLFPSYGIHRDRIRVEWNDDDGALWEKVDGAGFKGMVKEDEDFFGRLLMSASYSMSYPANTCGMSSCADPCTVANIATNRLYHEHCSDTAMFLQCDLGRNCFVMPCATGTIWSAVDNTCISDNGIPTPATTNMATGTTVTAATCFNCSADNPCIGPGYHTHCNSSMFVQCDAAIRCYEMPCADGLVWSQDDLTCISNSGGVGAITSRSSGSDGSDSPGDSDGSVSPSDSDGSVSPDDSDGSPSNGDVLTNAAQGTLQRDTSNARGVTISSCATIIPVALLLLVIY